MKRVFLLIIIFVTPAFVYSGSPVVVSSSSGSTSSAGSSSMMDRPGISLSLGTTGVGLQLVSPRICDFRARLGASWMPKFEHSAHFDIMVGNQTEWKYDANGNRVQTKFDRLSAKLEEVTGYRVDDEVEMICTPSFSNLSLIIDYFPLHNRHWYVSAGVLYGSKIIGEAINSLDDAPALSCVNFYNHVYDKMQAGEPIYNGMYLDVEQEEKVLAYGRMGIYVGDKDTGPYLMTPDTDCTVSATVHVNRWKPYLGCGYTGRLLRNNDLYHIGFDCGVLFWGGVPSIVTHDGTNLSKEVYHIRGKVGDYVSFVKSFHVMPVLNLTLTRHF